MTCRRMPAILACLACASALRAETTNVVCAAADIVRGAVEYSRALRIADQEVQAARGAREQSRARTRPSLTAGAQASYYDGLHDWALGATPIPAVEDRYSAGLTLSQPLYAGGRLVNAEDAASHRKGAAQYRYVARTGDVQLEALAAYWSWAKGHYAQQTLRTGVARMEAHARDVRNARDAGMATENDVLSSDVVLERTRLRLEAARRATDTSRALIERLTGSELPPATIPENPPAARAAAIREADAVAMGMDRRRERVAARLEAEAAASEAKAARAGFLPEIYLTARYEQANPNLLNIPPREEWQEDLFAGVTLSWNVLDWGLSAGQADEADARAAQARLRLEQTVDTIRYEVREALINLRDAVARAEVAARAEASAERSVQTASDLWQNGLARNSDVLDALSEFTDAQFERISANADASVASAALERAMGTLKSP